MVYDAELMIRGLWQEGIALDGLKDPFQSEFLEVNITHTPT